jgi:hypothetical protein
VQFIIEDGIVLLSRHMLISYIYLSGFEFLSLYILHRQISDCKGGLLEIRFGVCPSCKALKGDVNHHALHLKSSESF